MVKDVSGSLKTRLVSGVAVLVSGLLLSACASGPEPAHAPAPPAVGQSEGAACDSDAVQYAIGEPFDEANASQLQSESGARQVRVLRPNSAATLDYREDRLNIHLDRNDNIEALRCG